MGQFEAAIHHWAILAILLNLVIDLVHQVAPCILQANEFPVVTQLTIVVAQDSADVVRGHQALSIRRNHQIATGASWVVAGITKSTPRVRRHRLDTTRCLLDCRVR